MSGLWRHALAHFDGATRSFRRFPRQPGGYCRCGVFGSTACCATRRAVCGTPRTRDRAPFASRQCVHGCGTDVCLDLAVIRHGLKRGETNGANFVSEVRKHDQPERLSGLGDHRCDLLLSDRLTCAACRARADALRPLWQRLADVRWRRDLLHHRKLCLPISERAFGQPLWRTSRCNFRRLTGFFAGSQVYCCVCIPLPLLSRRWGNSK
jgi:hypothetical protein